MAISQSYNENNFWNSYSLKEGVLHMAVFSINTIFFFYQQSSEDKDGPLRAFQKCRR